MTASLAIIGGGFSGLMALRHAVAHPTPIAIDLYEANEASLAKGLAYGTTEPDHLLNVPAAKMGAYPDKIDDFYLWLQRKHPSYAADSFVPRRIYAEYLSDILDEAKRIAGANGHVLNFIFARVDSVSPLREVVTATGVKRYDAIILATGHYGLREWLPDTPGALLRPWDQVAAQNFWQWFETQSWKDDSQIVLVGTGLSAVDMLHSLKRRNYPGKIVAVSRHATFPAVHQLTRTPATHMPKAADYPAIADEFRAKLAEQMRDAGDAWRSVVDDVRPITNAIWQQFSDAEREGFLRRHLAWWNPLRHRMPTESAALLTSKRLSVESADVQGCSVLNGKIELKLASGTLTADALISTTGFTYRAADASGSLIALLVEHGVMRPTSYGIGLESGDAGKIADGIFVTGPLRFGALFETLAVPELRAQAREAAEAAMLSLA